MKKQKSLCDSPFESPDVIGQLGEQVVPDVEDGEPRSGQ